MNSFCRPNPSENVDFISLKNRAAENSEINILLVLPKKDKKKDKRKLKFLTKKLDLKFGRGKKNIREV